MKILVTGGLGYIGSHTVAALTDIGHEVVIVDNLSNSSQAVLGRLETITHTPLDFYELDLADKPALDKVFSEHEFDAVIHFAGLKAVGESVAQPVRYYRHNIDSTLSLLEVMQTHNVHKLVFSSSATVYGSAPVPYTETSPAGSDITSPYGKTKYMIEQIMLDTANANPENYFVALRYFNPVGAHESGLIGEDPLGIPNNLMPFISQVASGMRDKLSVFGNDYDTPDGTCLRDFIHVVDLARGHIAALENIQSGFDAINLGSGRGTSVLELVRAFEKSTGQKIPYEIESRRAGDLPAFWANPEKAHEKLGWSTTKTLEDMCRDTWNWQSKNPKGYATTA